MGKIVKQKLGGQRSKFLYSKFLTLKHTLYTVLRTFTCTWALTIFLKESNSAFQWFSLDVENLSFPIYPENLNVIEQQTSEICKLKKKRVEDKKNGISFHVSTNDCREPF